MMVILALDVIKLKAEIGYFQLKSCMSKIGVTELMTSYNICTTFTCHAAQNTQVSQDQHDLSVR